MTDGDRAAFLTGDRPEEVLVYLDGDAVSSPGALDAHAERVDGGFALVLPGEEGRGIFRRATGIDPMAFAREAMATEGEVSRDCTGGVCPNGEGKREGKREDHRAQFVFAFAEAENPEAGGLYAEGDVIHAYVACTCGEAYSEKWVAGE